MKVWRELPGSSRKFGLMEQSWNSEGDILTNLQEQLIITPLAVPVRDNSGEMSAL